MPITATPGAEDANSYLSLEDATAILATRAGSDWTDFGEDEQEAALVTATNRLEQESYQGSKAGEEQALAFPRTSLRDKNGSLFDDEEIPLPVQLACAELALQIARNPELFDDTGLENISSFSKGDLSLTPRGRAAGRLPAQVKRFLRGIRVDNGSSLIRA
jgi:hypothetical protein